VTKSRDPWLDNAKTVLVVLVVVGHSLVLLPAQEERNRLYDFIYYWHMPAFVLVSGYLSRGFRYDRKHLTQLVTMFVVPYVIFSWLMAMWRIHVTHEVAGFDSIWLNPRWPMWYLCAMIMWRLLTPLLRSHPAMILIAIAASVTGGHWSVELFDINRTIGFLPFFTIGLHLGAREMGWLRSPWSRVPAIAFFAFLALWIVPRTDRYWSTSWMFFRDSFEMLDVDPTTGMVLQFCLIVIGLCGALSALALIPRRWTFLAPMGAYTIVVYLLHGFVIRWLAGWGWAEKVPLTGVAQLLVTVALAIGLGLLLGWPPLARRLNYLVDPVGAAQKAKRALAAS
jgi:fucose 4-O-acetylase-like acetyltransferase